MREKRGKNEGGRGKRKEGVRDKVEKRRRKDEGRRGEGQRIAVGKVKGRWGREGIQGEKVLEKGGRWKENGKAL